MKLMLILAALICLTVVMLAQTPAHSQLAAAADPPSEPLDAFEQKTLSYTGGKYKDETFKYLLLKPRNMEAGKKYPLMLFLHGAGERGKGNMKLAITHFPAMMTAEEYRDKYPCFLVVPQCRKDEIWASFHWRAKDRNAGNEPSDMLKMALQAVDETIASQPVDEDRLYLTGLSMGGFGSWDLAARQPQRWAAVAPVCGGGDVKTAAKLVNVPLWAIHGDADTVVPPKRSREMIEAVKAAGGKPRYTEYAGVGHNSWTRAYSDPQGILPWLFTHRLSDREK